MTSVQNDAAIHIYVNKRILGARRLPTPYNQINDKWKNGKMEKWKKKNEKNEKWKNKMHFVGIHCLVILKKKSTRRGTSADGQKISEINK